jgi:REP element-mobilizing transposase RayT
MMPLVGAVREPALPTPFIPKNRWAVNRAFKTVSTKQINLLNQTPGAALWQRNYFEHIIRNVDDLRRIRAYISNNPLRWTIDRENAPFQ